MPQYSGSTGDRGKKKKEKEKVPPFPWMVDLGVSRTSTMPIVSSKILS